MHPVRVQLHPEVQVKVSVNVARSTEEAERQARGEDVTVIRDEAPQIETFNEDAAFEDSARPRVDPEEIPGMGEQPKV